MATGPIFVAADEPLIVFESLDRALAYLEWQDVEDGLYTGYDSDGRLVRFGTETIPKRRFTVFRDKQVVADVESEPSQQRSFDGRWLASSRCRTPLPSKS